MAEVTKNIDNMLISYLKGCLSKYCDASILKV